MSRGRLPGVYLAEAELITSGCIRVLPVKIMGMVAVLAN